MRLTRFLAVRILLFIGAGLMVAAAFAQSEATMTSEERDRLIDLTYLVEDHDAPRAPGGWARIMTDKDILMQGLPEAVSLSVFERRDAAGELERVIVFNGSRLWGDDWWHNAGEYLGSVFGTTDRATHLKMYEQAQAWTKGIVEKALEDGAQISFVGYSRGGFFATAMAGVFGRRAVTFNAPTFGLGLDFLDAGQQARAWSLTTDVHSSLDPVLNTRNLPMSRPITNTWVISPSSDAMASILENPGAIHGVQTIRQSLAAGEPLREVLPVDWETGNLFLSQATVLADGLDHIAAQLGHSRTAAGLEKLGDLAGMAGDLTGLAAAIRADMQASREHPVLLLRSATVDALGSLLLTGSKLLHCTELPHLEDGGMIPLAQWAQRHGMLKQLGPVTDKMPTFGALDAIGALRDAAMDRRITIDTIEKGLDATVGFTWAVAGFLASGGNLAAADRAEAYGTTLARTGRYLLADSDLERLLLTKFDWGKDGLARQPGRMLGLYADTVESAAQHGLKPPGWIEFFGGKGADAEDEARRMLKASGFSESDFQRLEDIAQGQTYTQPGETAKTVTKAAAPKPAPAASVSRAAGHPTDELGGVSMKSRVHAGSFKAAPPGSLSGLREAARSPAPGN